MKKAIVVACLLVSSLSVAEELWTHVYHREGCGGTIHQAKQSAKTKAENTSEYYSELCKSDNGNYEIIFTDGACLQETGDVSCPVSCTVIGNAKCVL